MSSVPRSNPGLLSVVAILLLALTGAGVTLSTTGSITVGPPRPAERILTIDERTYYEFVSPRLDRLVEEVDGVVQMVNKKSRDLIALSLSEARIKTLTDEITAYEDGHGVPERFRSLHEEIVSGTSAMIDTFGEAKSALSRFKFSKMTTLIDEFNNAADELHRAQDHLRELTKSYETEPSGIRGITI